ncbi:SDR family NAD(P)-dependent oxidoreductase [Prochlorococcus marinus]|uniref:SDR family NAD(P)-dependent oxidoreductase n=1 Tax=Prochlorococcus marinus TaxID=1219 RepID=UPI0022B313DC|nr:SDR family NAD(P)-dependent oxidoreductase [Prochlorococcus marinus]
MRNILISGASRGIGRCIAKRAIEDGHNVSIGVRNIKSFKDYEISEGNLKANSLLVNKYESNNNSSISNWISNTNRTFGKIDTLIHCAGIFKPTEFNFKTGEEKDIEELLKVNLMGPWLLTKAAWKYLIKNNNSRIIVLVSMSGKRSKGKLAGYTASKFALMGLCQTIRNEGWEYGLRVTAICPSWVNTDMANNLTHIQREDMTQPKELALIVSRLLELSNTCIPFELSINCNLEI